jgi:FlaA1/EpsC-like NDP-sugar epimerase
MIAVNAAYFIALWIRFDCKFQAIPHEYLDSFLRFAPIYTVFCLVVFWVLHLYRSIWRFASYSELSRMIVATGITGVFHTVLITLLFHRMPLVYYTFGIVIQFIFTLGIRFSYRFVLLERGRKTNVEEQQRVNRVMLIGGGAAGRMILRDLNSAKETSDQVYCIIDDNRNKWNRYIDNVPIVGGREDILENVEKFKIDKIYIAIPSATAAEKRDILDICKESGCEMKNLPGMYQFVTGEVRATALKDVAIEDLLGRDQIKVNMDEIFRYLSGKVILVTGGGGSIGSELCRQIAGHQPKQLIIFDVYENNAHAIGLELRDKYPDLNLEVLIGSVRDSRRINSVFQKYKPDVVYHAAAHKHVPLMEDSPNESIKNNAVGTYKTAYAAMMNGCQRFVLISTDKAVNPTNIMGASKRLCEMVIQSFDKMIKAGKAGQIPVLYAHADDEGGHMIRPKQMPKEIHTEFVAVRFGNVLGSNGSVIPRFKEQIAKGGPVTVTHPDIIRYFMTIPEAVSLVLQAGTYAHGGEIFVLDMGSPVKIDTLARNMIKLSGFKPDVDIRIEYTGLRPGEKLYEEKLMGEEGMKKTDNELIHIGSPLDFDAEQFLKDMHVLMKASYDDSEDIRAYVRKIVPTYHPAGRHGSEERGSAYTEQIRAIMATKQ